MSRKRRVLGGTFKAKVALKMELEWLKKKLPCSTNQKRLLVEPIKSRQTPRFPVS